MRAGWSSSTDTGGEIKREQKVRKEEAVATLLSIRTRPVRNNSNSGSKESPYTRGESAALSSHRARRRVILQ